VGLPLYVSPATQSEYASLSWSSATGQFFSVQYSTNLANEFMGMLQSNLLATPPTNFLAVPVTNNHVYYRLRF